MKKGIASILCIVLLISMTSIAFASGTTLKIDKVSCCSNEIVDVPITISGNMGIAGAVIRITYDSNLELVKVATGEAFSSLTYTPPAKLTSNPITLLWDGIEADASNGTIATLQFRVPENAGVYNVSASYDVGGIYDGDMEDIDVAIENGNITVKKQNSMTVSVTDTVSVELDSEEDIAGTVYIALYGKNNSLLELHTSDAKKSISSKLEKINSGKYVKVLWWKDGSLEPYCNAVKIDL